MDSQTKFKLLQLYLYWLQLSFTIFCFKQLFLEKLKFRKIVLYHFPHIYHFLCSLFLSFQFAHSVVSDSLRPYALQHTSLPCPSPTPGIYSNSCPLNRWMPSNHLILCCPLLLLPSVFPSIRVFFNESVLHIRWPKYWC